jgi:site-specific recombinase XerC
MALSTIKRRLSSVSGLYGYLVARGDVTVNPVLAASDARWERIVARAPQLAATLRSYLEQMALSLRPASIEAIDLALRGFAGFLTATSQGSR